MTRTFINDIGPQVQFHIA